MGRDSLRSGLDAEEDGSRQQKPDSTQLSLPIQIQDEGFLMEMLRIKRKKTEWSPVNVLKKPSIVEGFDLNEATKWRSIPIGNKEKLIIEEASSDGNPNSRNGNEGLMEDHEIIVFGGANTIQIARLVRLIMLPPSP